MSLKHLPFICLLSLCTLWACQSDDDIAQGFSLSSNDVCLNAEGGQEVLRILSDDTWTASASAPWLCVSPANGTGSAQLSLHVDSTLSDQMREAEIRFTTPSHAPLYLKVTQLGYGKHIVAGSDTIDLKYSDQKDKRHFELKVATNVAFNVVIDYIGQQQDWITGHDFEVTLDRGARPRTATLRFDWKMNADDALREAKLRFVPANVDDVLQAPSEVVVRQAAAPTITDDRQGDSLAVMLIQDRMNCMTQIDASENMMYWNEVELWEAGDKDLPSPDAVGRIRYVGFTLVNTDESLAPEVGRLRYVERLAFYGNYNTMLKSIDLGTEVCSLRHLKHLQIAAYGLVSLPDELTKLGPTLETLDLNSNNFTAVPAILTKENFPHLKSLNLSTNRRWTCSDLRSRDSYDNGIGLYVNINRPDNDLRRLLLWDTLEKLALSYNYLEGQLPEFSVGQDGVGAYTQADVEAWGGDTIANMVGRPKVLPRMKDLRLNLNFLSGPLPQWILYHPHLMDWDPESFIFTTQEKGITSSGTYCGFTNVPDNFDYYYNFFPGYKNKYYLEAE